MPWDQPYVIFIRNIPKRDRDEIALRWLFSSFGKILLIEVSRWYLGESEAKIEFAERESALNAVRKKQLNGMTIKKDWIDYDVTLDRLNFDCLFEIYSYLTLDDSLNLSKLNELQKHAIEQMPFYMKTNDDDFMTCVRNIYKTISKIFKVLNPPKVEQAIAILHNLPPGDSNLNLNVESQLLPFIETVSLCRFNFACLTVDDLYFIEYICPNLNSLKICDDTWPLLFIQPRISKILKDSKKLKLHNPDLFLICFTSAKFRENMDLKIIDIEKESQKLEKLGEIDSLRSLNHAVKCLQKISNITSYILRNIRNYAHHRDTILEKLEQVVDIPVAPDFINNFKYLSGSSLGKLLQFLEIDFDFFNMTEDDMEHIANYENLKELKIICHPRILESTDFLTAMQQLMSYNKLENLEIYIKWVERSDNFERFAEDLKLKIQKIMKRNIFKKTLILKIRVHHSDRSNQFKFVLNGKTFFQKGFSNEPKNSEQ